MRNANRIFAGLIASSLFISNIPMISFAEELSSAEGTSSTMENSIGLGNGGKKYELPEVTDLGEWKGIPELTNKEYDTWDGTMDSFDWFFDHKGTEDDPYIIDSAEDLMSMKRMWYEVEDYNPEYTDYSCYWEHQMPMLTYEEYTSDRSGYNDADNYFYHAIKKTDFDTFTSTGDTSLFATFYSVNSNTYESGLRIEVTNFEKSAEDVVVIGSESVTYSYYTSIVAAFKLNGVTLYEYDIVPILLARGYTDGLAAPSRRAYYSKAEYEKAGEPVLNTELKDYTLKMFYTWKYDLTSGVFEVTSIETGEVDYIDEVDVNVTYTYGDIRYLYPKWDATSYTSITLDQLFEDYYVFDDKWSSKHAPRVKKVETQSTRPEFYDDALICDDSAYDTNNLCIYASKGYYNGSETNTLIDGYSNTFEITIPYSTWWTKSRKVTNAASGYNGIALTDGRYKYYRYTIANAYIDSCPRDYYYFLADYDTDPFEENRSYTWAYRPCMKTLPDVKYTITYSFRYEEATSTYWLDVSWVNDVEVSEGVYESGSVPSIDVTSYIGSNEYMGFSACKLDWYQNYYNQHEYNEYYFLEKAVDGSTTLYLPVKFRESYDSTITTEDTSVILLSIPFIDLYQPSNNVLDYPELLPLEVTYTGQLPDKYLSDILSTYSFYKSANVYTPSNHSTMVYRTRLSKYAKDYFSDHFVSKKDYMEASGESKTDYEVWEEEPYYVNKYFKLSADIHLSNPPVGFENEAGYTSYWHTLTPGTWTNCTFDLNGHTLWTETPYISETRWSEDCEVSGGSIIDGASMFDNFCGTIHDTALYAGNVLTDSGYEDVLTYFTGHIYDSDVYATDMFYAWGGSGNPGERLVENCNLYVTPGKYVDIGSTNITISNCRIMGYDYLFPNYGYIYSPCYDTVITGLKLSDDIYHAGFQNCIVQAELRGYFSKSAGSVKVPDVNTYFNLTFTDPEYTLYDYSNAGSEYCTFDVYIKDGGEDGHIGGCQCLIEYGKYTNCDITFYGVDNVTVDTNIGYFYRTSLSNCNIEVGATLSSRSGGSYPHGQTYGMLYGSTATDCLFTLKELQDVNLTGWYNNGSGTFNNCNIVVDRVSYSTQYDERPVLFGYLPIYDTDITIKEYDGLYAGISLVPLHGCNLYLTIDDVYRDYTTFGEDLYIYHSTSAEPTDSNVFVDFTEDATGELSYLFNVGGGSINNISIYIGEMPDSISIADTRLLHSYRGSTITNMLLVAHKLNIVGASKMGFVAPFTMIDGYAIRDWNFSSYATEEKRNAAISHGYNEIYYTYETTEEDGTVKYWLQSTYNDPYYGSTTNLSNSSFFVNLYGADMITRTSVLNYMGAVSNIDATINVFTEEGSVASTPVCIHDDSVGQGSNKILNGWVLRSNTTNGQSGLMFTDYYLPALVRNCYMDLPNAQCNDFSGDYTQPGFVVDSPLGINALPNELRYAYLSYSSKYDDEGTYIGSTANEYNNSPSAAWGYHTGSVQFSKCYVPNGQSGFGHWRSNSSHTKGDSYDVGSSPVNSVLTRYRQTINSLIETSSESEDIPLLQEKVTIFEKLCNVVQYNYYRRLMLNTNSSSDIGYYNSYVENNGIPSDEDLALVIPDPGIDTKLATTADSDGTLAYLLDNGQSVKFRTTNWTVMEPDTWLIHPITGERLFEFPVQTCLTALGSSPATFTDVADFGAIYKTTIIPAEHGSVAIAGINGVPVTEGFIYSKPNQPMVASITPDSDNFILAYATHKLGEGNTARIPSTKLAVSTFASSVDESYTIEGYSQQGIDTVITPIFKEKFTITVDIEDSEHGTVIVPYTVSTEGELLTVDLDVEPGYTITDLQLNGNPLTESKFYMPAENVVITGKCVPFEGGITEFYLMGSAGTINHIEQTINVTVPTSPYICNALPTITYVGDYLTPSESARQDFSNASETPVTYTVHYGDNQTISYDVYVHQTPKTQKIYEFSLLGINGEVDNANNRIKVRVPSGTDLSNLKPDLISYSADAISADETVARDFGVPQMYTLTTAGMQARTYTVIAEEMSGTDAYIDEFKVSGIQGDIDEETKTITLNIPKMMNLTNIQPDYISYVGSSISPSKAAEVNLEDSATYTVQSLSGTSTTYNVQLNRSGDSEAAITEFKLAGIDGVIDDTAKTITVPVPVTTNIAGIAPDVLTFTGKSIYPVPTATQDFTQPVTYTVVAQDNTEVEYDIVIQPLTSEGKLIEFELQGYPGVINENDKTVTITDFPRDLNLKDIVPSKFVTSAEATSDPDANTPQDFTKPVEYEISSKYGDDVNTYTVNVILEALNQDARIDRFVIDGHEATIDQINGMITLELPSTYKPADINGIVPEIEWVGETLNPDENDAQNFNQAITYTVTAEDPQVQREYDVVVTIEQISEHDPYIIEAFSILGYAGLVNQDTGAIDIHVPYSKAEDIKYTVPTIVWHADTITPADNRANDFSTQQTYTVTNKAGFAKSYYVNVHLDSSSGPVIPTQGNPSITRFELCGEQGVIDQAAATIKVTIFTSDTFDPSLDHDIPDGITFVGDSISPDVTEPQDFTKPVSYTVTDDGTTKTYQVIVEKRKPETGDPVPAEQCIINKFTLLGVDGTIDQTAKTIKFQFTEDKRNELKSAIPTIDWEGTTIIPNEGIALDFTTVRTYTVSTSTDSKTYTVTVDIGDGSDFNDEYPYITRFNLLGVNGNIDQDARTITFEFDWAYYEQLINTDATIIWRGDTITPDGATKMDYTTPKRFTVSKGDQSKTYTVTVTLTGTPPAGLDCSIDKFTLLGVDGVIDQTAKTIKFTFPESAKENLLNTVPVIEWTGSSISPKANAAQNFTVPISYTVKNIDATASKTYAVTVEFTPDTDDNDPNNICIIDKFTLCGYTGSINQTNGTIVVQLPTSKAEEIKSAVPSIVWRGETITPTESTAQDFSNPVKYRVTAKNPTKFKDYTVTVAFTGIDDACDINRFILCGIDGVIDRIDRTITVTVPYKEKANLSKAIPVIDWTGTKLTPDEKTAMNFNVPVKYTVSCEDSSLTKTYIVRVYVDEPDSDCSINSFALLGKSATVDQTTRTITLTLDKETFEDRIKNAVPTIGWSGESITPKDNAPQDFSKDIFYTVTAEDPDISKTYTVHVELDDQREPLITNFRLYSYAGYINQFTGVIKVKLPYSYKDKLNNAVPYIEWEGEKITPGDNVAQNFNDDVTYVVSVGDKEKSYAVQVEYDADTTCKITKFTLLGEKGRINQSSGNIYIDMPYDKSEDLANAVPEITWEGETLTPDERAAQDFNNDIVYTVTAENEDYSKKYTVIVQVEEPEEGDPEGEDPDEGDDDDGDEDEGDDDDGDEDEENPVPPVEDDYNPGTLPPPINKDEEDEEDEDTPNTGVGFNTGSLLGFLAASTAVAIFGKRYTKRKTKK